MHAIKLFLKLIFAIVILVVLAIGSLLIFIDPNDYKDDITQIVEEQTGREFSMQNISLSFYPKIGLSLEKAQLSNAQGFSKEPFAAIDEIQVGAAILPLFQKQLVVDALLLDGLQLNLQKNPQGITNWQDLVKNSEEKPDETSKTEAGNPLSQLASLQFGGLNILNGQIHWQDASQQQDIKIHDLNLTSGAVELNQFFPVEFSAKTKVKNPSLSSEAKVNLAIKILENGQIELKNLLVNNQIRSQELPFEQLLTEVSIPVIALSQENQRLNLPEIQADFNLKGRGDFPLEKSHAEIKIANFDMDLSKQTAKLEKVSLQTMNITTEASVSIRQLIDSPVIKADLSTTEFNLRKLLTDLNIELPPMQSAAALQRVSQQMSLNFDSKTQSLSLSKLKAKMDDSNLSGSASVSNFTAPAIRFDLALDQIKVDDYLPPKSERAPTEEESGKEVVIELPEEMIRTLNIDGQLNIADLNYDKLNPKNISIKIKAKDGKVAIAPATADLFGTRLTMQSSLDVTGKEPVYSTRVHAPKVPVGEVLVALGQTDTLSGMGSVNADLTTHGKTVKSFMANLDGKADVDLKNGAIKGFNLAQTIREAKAKLSGKSLKTSAEPKQTDFSELIAKVDIDKGLVQSREITALSPYMRIKGDGTADLGKEVLDFLVKTKIVGTEKGQGGKELEDLKGLTIPVKLKGNLYDPKISLDLKALLDAKAKQKLEEKKAELKAKAEEKVEKKKEEMKEKVEEKVQDKLKDTLKGFGF